MKLLQLGIDGYRGINGGLDRNTINLSNSNAIFIFGQNNVGKSTFLRAYIAFYENTVTSDDFAQGLSGDIVVEITLRVDESTDKEFINEHTGGKFNNLKTKYIDSKGVIKIRKTWKRSDSGKTPQDQTFNVQNGSWEDISYGGVGAHGVFQSLLMKPLYIEAMPTEAQVENVVNAVLRDAAQKKLSDHESNEYKEALKTISELQDKAYSKTNIDLYKSKVNEHFQKLFAEYAIDIDDGTSRVKFSHDKLGKDFKIDFHSQGNENRNSYSQMGHGAVRMAIFLLMLFKG